MVPKWLTALLVLLHEAWSTRRDAHIRFLTLQVEMLKSRLPGNRVILAPVERQRSRRIWTRSLCRQRLATAFGSHARGCIDICVPFGYALWQGAGWLPRLAVRRTLTSGK